MHTCLICIGSNAQPERNLGLAQRELKELFPGIRFSLEQETAPLHLTNPARFTNQVAAIETTLSQATIRSALKEIERRAGRLPEDKGLEKVCLDIDLLTFDDQVLKPADMERDYIVAGIKELYFFQGSFL